MILRRGWNIHTRTQLISVGPALLLTLLLTGFFTFARLQDLRQELNHYGQLIANQLAPASTYGVISGNTDVLDALLQATLKTPHVRFLEVRDRNGKILVYVEQTPDTGHASSQVEIFQAPIQRPNIALGQMLHDGDVDSAHALGSVVVGMSNDAFKETLIYSPALAQAAACF